MNAAGLGEDLFQGLGAMGANTSQTTGGAETVRRQLVRNLRYPPQTTARRRGPGPSRPYDDQDGDPRPEYVGPFADIGMNRRGRSNHGETDPWGSRRLCNGLARGRTDNTNIDGDPDMYRFTLIAAMTMTTTLASAGSSAPEDCQFTDDQVPGESATMACYAALDRDGDGALSPDEAAALPRIQDRIGELDRDDNGLLSADEFQAEMATPAQRGGGKGV